MRTAVFPMRALRLAGASLPVVASLTVVGVVSRAGPVDGGCAQASTAHHATLVVEHANGTLVKVCVPFSEVQITGEQLLQRSGLEYSTQPYGGSGDAVCQIDMEPAAYTNCFQGGMFWAMFVSRAHGAWGFSSQGVSSQLFGDGDAEGFRYESQSDSSPPASSPAGVCPPPTTATPSPVKVTAKPSPAGSSATNPPTRTTAPTSRLTASPSGIATTTPSATGADSTSAGPSTAAAAGVAASATPPPSRPGVFSAGLWAAAALAIALLGGLVFQLVRFRRRPSSQVPQ